MGFLSKQKEIIMIVVTWIPSILSIIGSSVIIYLSTRKTSKKSAYNRLLIGMSVMDLINTTSWILQPFVLPQTGGRVWAVGNDATCQAGGFFVQLGTAVALYNASLAVYFCATIVFGLGHEAVEKILEPVSHGASILYPLITGLIIGGFRMSSEAELGMLCWFLKYPSNCKDDPDVYCLSQLLGWIFTGGPHLITLLIMVVCNILVFCKVRKSMNQNNRYNFERQNRAASAEGGTRNSKVSFAASIRSSIVSRRSSGGATTNSATRRVRDVGTQSLLYVLASINTVVWMIALRMVEGKAGGYVDRDRESEYYWLVIIVQLTFPSQGFFNALIFIRPKYFRWRRRHPEDSKWQCLLAALSSNPSAGRNKFTSMCASTGGLPASKQEGEVQIVGLNDSQPRKTTREMCLSIQSECSSDDEALAGSLSNRLSLKASVRKLQLELEGLESGVRDTLQECHSEE